MSRLLTTIADPCGFVLCPTRSFVVRPRRRTQRNSIFTLIQVCLGGSVSKRKAVILNMNSLQEVRTIPEMKVETQAANLK